MKCPFCREGDFAVVDSRSHRGGFPIRRKRICTQCKRRVMTVEYVEEAPLKVIKKDLSREPFDLAKLRRAWKKLATNGPSARNKSTLSFAKSRARFTHSTSAKFR